MGGNVRIAVAGAGLIGARHIEHVVREATLCAVVDPAPAGKAAAERHGVPWYPRLGALFDADRPDGVVVATPNRLHVETGLECVLAGVPALIEKPIADDPDSAETLVRAAEDADVPLLVGHHRRHNPLIRRARAMIDEGRLGTIVAASAQCWLYKPADYFDVNWRREPGAGPVLLNLIHDIDLLRHLCGEVAAVQAICSNAARSFPIEDTAGILLRFASGAIGTITVSDTIVAPWSWELTAGENRAYPRTGASCCQIGGTHASLSIPDLGLWRYSGARGWQEPLARETSACDDGDPLALQIRHFADVACGLAEPLVSGRQGLATLKVAAAVKQAAESGSVVKLA